MTLANEQTRKIDYTARTHTSGGRDGGTSRTDDGRLDVKLSVPGTGTGTNPEQLFAAGWSTCFLSAIRKLAFQQKISLPPDAAIDAEVDLVRIGNAYELQARLNVSLPGLAAEVSRSLVEGAHLICPYSKATRGNVDVVLNVI